jgi:uncharacterized Zn finger protein
MLIMIDGQCPKCKNLTLQEELVLDDQILIVCSSCGFTDQDEMPDFPEEA